MREVWVGWGMGHVVLGVREKREASFRTRNSNFLAIGLGVPAKCEKFEGGSTEIFEKVGFWAPARTGFGRG